MFIAGLALFSGASLACGLATSEATLIAARAIQGVGAAIISPAALSILMTTFDEGAERNKALGIWGAVAGTGGAAGVLLGGILTDQLNWSWIFYINVPVGLAAIALAPRILRESRIEQGKRAFDFLGAVLVTGGLSLLVYALVQTVDHSWTSPRTIAMFVGSAVLLAGFIATERRAHAPLMPLRLFRNRSLAGGNVVGLMLGASIFSMFFLLTLYMQQVLGYSALKTGIGYLLVSGVIIVSAGASQALVTKIGVRTVLATGMGLTAVGLVYFSQVSVGGSYLVDLAPGFILTGVGLGLLVRARHDRRTGRRRIGRGGSRLGHHQHVAADGRRAGDGDPLDRRLHAGGRLRDEPRRRRRSCRCSRRSTATRRRSWSGRSSPRSAWSRR